MMAIDKKTITASTLTGVAVATIALIITMITGGTTLYSCDEKPEFISPCVNGLKGSIVTSPDGYSDLYTRCYWNESNPYKYESCSTGWEEYVPAEPEQLTFEERRINALEQLTCDPTCRCNETHCIGTQNIIQI